MLEVLALIGILGMVYGLFVGARSVLEHVQNTRRRIEMLERLEKDLNVRLRVLEDVEEAWTPAYKGVKNEV